MTSFPDENILAAPDMSAVSLADGGEAQLSLSSKKDTETLPDESFAVSSRELSPLALAFLGDGVLELLVRRRLVATTRLQPGALHARAAAMVSARGQAAALSAIEPLFTEEEQGWLRRGRNASKATVAKHATPEEYRASTGLECLFGWLYLNGHTQRISRLFEAFWASFSA